MKYTFILLVCLLSFDFSFSQTTVNPPVSSIPSNWKIEKVEIDDKYTIITASFYESRRNSYYSSPYIMFPSKMLLFKTNESLTSNVVKNIAPFQKDLNYYTKYGETYRVFLFFDKINAGVDEISISAFKNENDQKWFEWGGIRINNPLNIAKTGWNEASLKNYFTANSKDPREGIYESLSSANTHKYKVGVVKNEFGFKVIFLSSDNVDELLKVGDVKGDLTSTASDNLFKAKWVKSDGRFNEDMYFSFSDFALNEVVSNSVNKLSFIKLFPTLRSPAENNGKSSGTGFLLNSDGYIATNYHVVEDAKIINVKGLNGDFKNSVTAKVIISDINNDLAIIKVDNNVLTDPPYAIYSKKIEPGNSIFCLGYPLRATMGDEVKVTNGIISSNSGFKNDISLYQISAPIQPGNSGGPLIDSKGNLIGIINAKHTDAENVSYAIKAAYLINLINLSDDRIRIQQVNKLSSLSLPEKIKLIKNSTYIIEVE